MLSRVAERVYWLARYLERVENTARLINVHTGLLMDLPRDVEIDWFTLVTIFDAEMFYHANFEQINENNVMQFLLAEPNNPISLLNSLSAVRENARTSLDILPEETWEQVNELYLLVKNETLSDCVGHIGQSYEPESCLSFYANGQASGTRRYDQSNPGNDVITDG